MYKVALQIVAQAPKTVNRRRFLWSNLSIIPWALCALGSVLGMNTSSMSRENRRLVTDEPVEVGDCMKFADYSRGI